MPKTVNFGVWEDGVFIGVVVYGHGASPKIGCPYGLNVGEIVELVRVALKEHTVEVSRIVAVSLRLLRKSSPGVRLVVSFADPEQDHHGGIYQAGGWIYTGRSADSTRVVTADGSTIHRRAYVGKNFGAKKTPMPPGSKMVRCEGKHRYLMPLDAAMRLDVAHLAMPYPKRPPSIVDALGTQSRDGSSNLTDGLQTSECDAPDEA
jgi:hypothetical protein